MNEVWRFFGDDRGACLAEYVLLVGLIAVVCLVAVTMFGGGVQSTYEMIVATVLKAIGG